MYFLWWPRFSTYESFSDRVLLQKLVMLSLKSLFHFFISVQYFSKTISAEKSYGFNLVEDDTAPIGIPD